MYKFLIINQPIWVVKETLHFFIRNNREGCKINIFPYNNTYCNVEIYLHPNHYYCVVTNYIKWKIKECKCSEKAKQWLTK